MLILCEHADILLKGNVPYMSEENKAKIRRILEETTNKGKLDVVD